MAAPRVFGPSDPLVDPAVILPRGLTSFRCACGRELLMLRSIAELRHGLRPGHPNVFVHGKIVAAQAPLIDHPARTWPAAVSADRFKLYCDQPHCRYSDYPWVVTVRRLLDLALSSGRAGKQVIPLDSRTHTRVPA